ncbi:MAG: hypothetical protein AB8F34_06820 [Akkermansiaceae bacterium]
MSGCNKSEAETLATNPMPPAEAGRTFKVIHVYVALCDNDAQGIAPVPRKIGNGDDPANNLYWGCSDGARPIFSKSKLWKRLSVTKVEAQPKILERLVFQHKKTKAILVVDAWRGSEIEPCIREFCQSLAGQLYESFALKIADKETRINLAGGADFLTFIGHNGLMEFRVPEIKPNPHRKQKVDAAVLCCQSKSFFGGHLKTANVKPAVMTASNMYPGAFIIRDVLEGWFTGESQKQLRLRAAKAYAKNQKISTKSAMNVFAPLP